jgi:hypothetical protein
MSTDEQKPTGKPLSPPRVVAFLRNGIFSKKRSSRLQQVIMEAERLENAIEAERLHHGPGTFVITQHGDDSPMACHPSSLFADTTDSDGWTQVGSECYTSKALLPLYVLRFRGFDDGRYIIFNDMSWRMKIRSVVSGNEAFLSVCSVRTHGLLCPLSSDQPPSRTATICALGGAHFKPDTPPPTHRGRQRFQHQSGDDGKLTEPSQLDGSDAGMHFVFNKGTPKVSTTF